jgi:hypothetical protein
MKTQTNSPKKSLKTNRYESITNHRTSGLIGSIGYVGCYPVQRITVKKINPVQHPVTVKKIQ